MLKFYLLGEEKYVVIDDLLPVFFEEWRGYTPEFARKSINGAWWQPLLEKGYAKWTKDYKALDGGFPMETLRMLTNMPVEHMYTYDLEE